MFEEYTLVSCGIPANYNVALQDGLSKFHTSEREMIMVFRNEDTDLASKAKVFDVIAHSAVTMGMTFGGLQQSLKRYICNFRQ